MSRPTIEQRVTEGAAWLDDERPDWWKRTDLAEFSLLTWTTCVLGQEYDAAGILAKGGKPRDAIPLDDDELQELGFAVRSYCEGVDAYERELSGLTAEWRRLIESRRAEVE